MKKWFIILGCFVVAVVASFIYFRGQTPVVSDTPVASGSASVAPTPPPPDPLVPINILLLGYGGAGHDGAYLSDTMILAKVIPKEKRILLFSIPRDLWVEIPFLSTDTTPFYSKINAVYAIGHDDKKYPDKPSEFTGKNGGGAAAMSVVSKIIGEEIDYYVGVDFAGFEKLLTTLAGKDGLTVDVPETFVDSFYPIEGEENNPCDFTEEEIASLSATLTGYELEKHFTCRYETLSYTKGKANLTPNEALKFARSRHSGAGGSDFGRARRQQAIINAVKNEILTPAFLLKVPSLFSEVNKTVSTDLSLGDITKMVTNYGDPRDFKLESYVFDTTNFLKDGRSRDGQYILTTKTGDFSAITEFVAEKAASSSATLQ
jgi:LCP family protein required for cell wall assembly